MSSSTRGAFSSLDPSILATDRGTRFVGLVLLALFLANALFAAGMNSGTCDELAVHLPCGYLYWMSGTPNDGLQNFPLGQLLVTSVVGVLRLPYTLYTEQHLFLFRLPCILMGLGLCCLVWRMATKIYGRPAGLAALFFAVLCPNLLAHSSLATLDLPATFFIFLTIFLLERVVEGPSVRRMLWLSLALAAVVLVKIQGLLLLPYALIVVLAHGRRLLTQEPRRRAALVFSLLLPPVVLCVLVNLVYRHFPGHGGGFLPPLFGQVLRGVLEHAESGHFAYLMGTYSTEGWWYFFPVAVLVKTPLGELVLAGSCLLRRPGRREVLFVGAPIAIVVGAGMLSRVNIGLRHVLPIYPFLAMAAGAGAVRIWGSARHAADAVGHVADAARPAAESVARALRVRRAIVATLMLTVLGHAIAITPHHLSYFNLLAGGAKNGHRLLIDSNYDWGQNDRFLRDYVARRGVPYSIDPYPARPVNGHILVNANALYGLMRGDAGAYAWLKRFSPIRQIAYTWFEFDVPSGTYREEPEDSEGRAAVIAHLFRLRAEASRVPLPGYRTVLARGFAEVGAYDAAFDQIREVLRSHPDFTPALSLGGELMIWWKLGMLVFHGEEYLTGIHTPDPRPTGEEDLEHTIVLARRCKLDDSLGRTHAGLGLALLDGGDRAGATDAFRIALRFDSTNGVARGALRKLGVMP